MSEAELHVLRGRMESGRLNKAERGELFSHLPPGYVRTPSAEITFDPDEQVQSVVRLVFAKFAELGSARRVLEYFLRHQIRMPVRPIFGPGRGQLEWRTASAGAIYAMLHHPIYAGAYTHGRSRMEPRRKRPDHPASGRVQLPMDQWRVLRRDDLPAYITWEQYLANRERLRQNVARFECRGVARGGPALLAGLVVCGRCGGRMYSHHNHTGRPRYVCNQFDRLRGQEHCPTLAARRVDELVSVQVLRALEPAALALSLRAAEDIERERERLDEHWRQRVERARYQAERAKRQYDAVEPENRLVARELERRWEEALLEARQAEEEYDRFRQQQPRALTAEDRSRIEALAADIPALWEAPTTTRADRQEIIRRLVERVVVSIRGDTEVVDVAIHWAGARVTGHELLRPVGRYHMLRDYDRLRARVRELREQGLSAARLAEALNEEGFRAPQRGQRFNKANIRQLLSRWELSSLPRKQSAPERLRAKHEWWANELVERLGMPLSTLCAWCRKGWVHARRVSWPGPGRWLIWADAAELRRLRRLKAVSHRGGHPYPTELTTPKPRPRR
jgi:recombinase-like zinc beta ribbon protein/recombinase